MKHLRIISTGLVAMLAFITMPSCKKDKVEPGVPPEETVAKLELDGRWKIETVNFLDEAVKWKEEVKFTSESGLGWAPGMYAKVMGINFQITAVNNEGGTKLGNKFSYIVGEELPLKETDTYWYWNYKDEQKNFEMKQINTTVLPYDFSILDITDLKIENNGDKVVFKANVNSRKPGEAITDNIKTPVEITLTRGVPSATANIRLKGQIFVMPALELTEEENRAVLLAELKEKMGFNSSYVFKMYVDLMGIFQTTIENFNWTDAVIQDFDQTEEKNINFFVGIDKKDVLYFYERKGNNDFNAASYNNYSIEKEGSLYTVWGEYSDGENIIYRGSPADGNTTIRVKITFNAESKETAVVSEYFHPILNYIEGGIAFKWIKDNNITNYGFGEELNPFPGMEF